MERIYLLSSLLIFLNNGYNMKISIMMVCYNRLELTKKTIENLISTTFGIDYNLIIIDNGSTDGTVEYLECLTGGNWNLLDIKFNKTNLGIGIARNQGLCLAEKYNPDYYCTIDNDVCFPNNWLAEAVDILERNRDFGSIGVNFEDTMYPLEVHGGKEFQVKREGNLGTACTVFSKNIKKMLGYYNIEFGLYGHEDADWGFRLNKVLKLKLGYIKEPGIHIGSGENDIGEYREFKTQAAKKSLNKFYLTCREYLSGKKPLHIKFDNVY